MKKHIPSALLAARIWILTCLVFGAGWFCGFLLFEEPNLCWTAIPATMASALASLPVLLVLFFRLPRIAEKQTALQSKQRQLGMLCAICCLVYGTGVALLIPFAGFPGHGAGDLIAVLACSGLLFVCSLVAIILSGNALRRYFSRTPPSANNKNTNMETTNMPEPVQDNQNPSRSNRILFKGIITAALILLMLIPTIFISNLVSERQQRQQEVAKEVSSRWAGDQTLTGPYIYLPYKQTVPDAENKTREETLHLLFIPENLEAGGHLDHELRRRSIYKVLLYRASLNQSGDFVLQLPKEIGAGQVQWSDARICYGLSDFKGIEEKLVIRFNGNPLELSPGQPVNDLDDKGLSAPVALSAADLGKSLSFQLGVHIKGSEMLHFVPLAGNSRFTLTSAWPDPSFDGSNLPAERRVSDSGFTAQWAFNKANLPFGTRLKDFKFDQSALAFGVTMVQPADEYAKTNRSVKYAILIIGLTFSIFFIVEIMQQKPLHPMQYVLIGLALVIFYSLLLAIGEFLLFDQAYALSALATIGLISLYAKSHFQNWRSAGIFGGVLTLLYGFIFVLVRLEDTALLLGSIGLFLILALTMFASKKINWYGLDTPAAVPQQE
jgi:inner membrane protein